MSGVTGTGGSLRLPLSPFHRTPSTPSLHGGTGSSIISGDLFDHPTPTSASAAGKDGKESLADLWASFLERSVEEGGGTPGADAPASRKDSNASAATSGR